MLEAGFGLLASKFREVVSKSKDYRMKNESEVDVGYSTGFLSFDFLNGTVVHVKSEDKNFSYYSTGIVDGSMSMIIGRSSCGKTTWAMQAAANIIRPFKTSTLFEDNIEGGLTASRREVLTKFFGEELKAKVISRNTGITNENFYERVKMIHDLKMENRASFEYDTGLYDSMGNRIYKLEPTVYLLDSLALLMPEKYTEEDEMSGQMSGTATARANAALIRRIIPMLKSANIILFIINHINQKVDINPMQRTKAQVSYLKQGEVLPGGNAAIYLSNNIIRFDDNSKLKESEAFGIDGALVDVSLLKSRTSQVGRSATLVFDYQKGFDQELSLFILLKNYNRVKGAGAYLYFEERPDLKFSQKQFKEKLASNPELQQVFMKEVMMTLQSMIKAPKQIVIEEEKKDISSEIFNTMKSMTVEDMQAITV